MIAEIVAFRHSHESLILDELAAWREEKGTGLTEMYSGTASPLSEWIEWDGENDDSRLSMPVGLLSPNRSVVIWNAQELPAKTLVELVDWLGEPSGEVNVALMYGPWVEVPYKNKNRQKIEKGRKGQGERKDIPKSLTKKYAVEESDFAVAPHNPSRRGKWAASLIEEEGGSISPADLKLMEFMSGGDASLYAWSVKSLMEVARGTKGEITSMQVKGSFEKMGVKGAFDLSNAINEGDVKGAAELVIRFTDTKRELLFLLTSLRRDFMMYEMLESGVPKDRIVEALSLYGREWLVDKASRSNPHFSEAQRLRAAEIIADADYQVKTGQGSYDQILVFAMSAAYLFRAARRSR